MGVPVYRTIFDLIQPDPFAAFPSLHSAYPWMIALFSFKVFKKKAIPVLIFPFGVWFSTIYLGEHYVIDVIGGVAYATIAFLLVEKLLPRLTQKSKSFAVGSSGVSSSVRWFYEAADIS
jgi:membrane-associated phospholipid phosphatase